MDLAVSFIKKVAFQELTEISQLCFHSNDIYIFQNR